jgi:hypothetical protein
VSAALIDVTKGSLNESLAHPQDFFCPIISFSAHSFILVHNHPAGAASPSEADLRLTRRVIEAARILQIQFLDHVIIGTGRLNSAAIARIARSATWRSFWTSGNIWVTKRSPPRGLRAKSEASPIHHRDIVL